MGFEFGLRLACKYPSLRASFYTSAHRCQFGSAQGFMNLAHNVSSASNENITSPIVQRELIGYRFETYLFKKEAFPDQVGSATEYCGHSTEDMTTI